MAFSLKSISREKVLGAAMLGMVLALFAFANHMFERLGNGPTVERVIETATLRGHGTLPMLHDAMVTDSTLSGKVIALSALPASDMFVKRIDVDQDVADILFLWAGVDTTPAQSYGPYIDARVAAFLKVIGTIPSTVGAGSVIPAEEAGPLTEEWFKAFEHYRLRLLSQAVGRHIFERGITYDAAKDTLQADGALNKNFCEDLARALVVSQNSGEIMHNFLGFIDQVKGFNNLSTAEQDMIMAMRITPSAPAEAVPEPGAAAGGVAAQSEMPSAAAQTAPQSDQNSAAPSSAP